MSKNPAPKSGVLAPSKTNADVLSQAKAERTVAVAFAKSTAKDDSGKVTRALLIMGAQDKGLSLARIAAAIGVERARLAHPGEDESTLVQLGAFAPYAVSKSSVGQYAQAVRLVDDAGVSRSAEGVILAAYKLVTRSGSSSLTADLAATVLTVSTEQRAVAFLAGVRDALLSLAASKSGDKVETPASDTESEDDGDVATESAPVPMSADVIAAIIREAASVEWSQEDGATLWDALAELSVALEARAATLV